MTRVNFRRSAYARVAAFDRPSVRSLGPAERGGRLIDVAADRGSVDMTVATSAPYAPATAEVLQPGMVLCAVVRMNTGLWSDNFIVTKLLVIPAAAFAAALLLLVEAHSVRFERADVLLLICLVLLIPSTLGAVSRGYAVSAAGVFADSLILFWV